MLEVNVSEKTQQSQNPSVSKQTFTTHMQEVLKYAENEGKEKVLPLFDEFDRAVCDYLTATLTANGKEDGAERERERVNHGCSKIMRRFFELESVYASETGKSPGLRSGFSSILTAPEQCRKYLHRGEKKDERRVI